MDESNENSAIAAWLRERVGGDGEVVLERIGIGIGVANVLHSFAWDGVDYVMRRPPAADAKLTASAGNMLREARVLEAMAKTSVRHPHLVGMCEDPSVIGCPFLVMKKVDGFTPVDVLPATHNSPQIKATFGLELVRALSEVAKVDWQAVGLSGYGKPDGFLTRQVDRWLWQLDSYRTRPLPCLDNVTQWLRENLPTPGPIGLMHGDYSLFNVMFGYDLPGRLAAIIDWDTSTIGEPLMDFGHLLSRWDQPDEEPTTLGSGDIADRTGITSRAAMTELYADLTGFDLSNITYYQVLSLFKLGCLMEGHFVNEMSGVASGGRFADSAPGLFRDALRIAQGGRR